MKTDRKLYEATTYLCNLPLMYEVRGSAHDDLLTLPFMHLCRPKDLDIEALNKALDPSAPRIVAWDGSPSSPIPDPKPVILPFVPDTAGAVVAEQVTRHLP